MTKPQTKTKAQTRVFPKLTPYQQAVLCAVYRATNSTGVAPALGVTLALERPLRDPTVAVLGEAGLLTQSPDGYRLTDFGLDWLAEHRRDV